MYETLRNSLLFKIPIDCVILDILHHKKVQHYLQETIWTRAQVAGPTFGKAVNT